MVLKFFYLRQNIIKMIIEHRITHFRFRMELINFILQRCVCFGISDYQGCEFNAFARVNCHFV